MQMQPVVFIAFEQAENLGIGYMAAVLAKAGYKTRVIDFRYKNEEILKLLVKHNPILVGFSVIFQYHIGSFRELVDTLRSNGIRCHFTAGGHYASLRYEELFGLIPGLDSVVRFEGEYTLLDLVSCISNRTDWRNIAGIAYKNRKGTLTANPLRPFEKVLDNFPLPVRSLFAESGFKLRSATILAGRGCVHSCSFCNIKAFYSTDSGPLKRIRRPEMVVNEMDLLYRKKHCSMFLFQDDDFPVKTENGKEWVERFCKELEIKGLKGKVMWKINCRPDEIDKEIFALMKESGLYHVFIGIEEGTDVGLKRLNKHLTVSKSMEGIKILKELGLVFDYGFMLFQPSSTFDSIHENLRFLRHICTDGYTSASFLKMLPYFETQIEKELREEERLKGLPGFYDYDFHQESLNHYFNFVNEAFKPWLRAPSGLLNNSKWARIYLSVYSFFYGSNHVVATLSDDTMKIVSESNLFLLDSMTELAHYFEHEHYRSDETNYLEGKKQSIISKHIIFNHQINRIVHNTLQLKENENFSMTI
jgi:anaerobic magnesium-protoporphyrin IX monomethyl ester cyclase